VKSWMLTLAVTAFLLIMGGLFFYHYLNPVNHFTGKDLPDLAVPAAPSVEEAPAGFNVLLLGIDARKQEESRTDLIMLVNVKPESNNITVISIPRDTRVFAAGIGETKINHFHILGEIKGGNHAGTLNSLKAVSDLMQCPIHYYVKINFTGFKKFMDSIGGIDIELEKPVQLTFAEVLLPAGEQHLDGELALKLVRERFSLPDGDFGRQRLQFIVLEALSRKLLEPENLPRLPAILRQAKQEVVDTNLTDSDLVSLAWLLGEMTDKDFTYFQIPGQGRTAFDPVVNTKLYYWIPDLPKVLEISQVYFK
jgi:LCP family protein required for cell wall assembly